MERRIETGEAECVALRNQLARLNALTRKQQLVRHFSQCQPECECRNRKDCGTMQRARKRSGEFPVAYRIWRNDVDRTAEPLMDERGANHPNGILQRDP